MKKILITIIGLTLILSLGGCNNTNKALPGDKVTISYTGTFINGDLFEAKTTTIILGSGNVIKGIEQAITNNKVGKIITKTIKPEDGYANKYSIYNQQRMSSYVFEKLGISTDTGTITTLDKTTGKIIGQEYDDQGNLIIIFDINPIETRQDILYKITIEKIEKNEESYTL